jgi:hypothetical protein
LVIGIIKKVNVIISEIVRFILKNVFLVIKLTVVRCIVVLIMLISKVIEQTPMMKMKRCATPSSKCKI